MPRKIAADATNNKTLNEENCWGLGFELVVSGLSLALQPEHIQFARLMQLLQTV